MDQKGLFGGAIVARFPKELVDASDWRQVPDHQEVFLYRNSSASIIIEILERVDKQNDTDAVKFHFDALAHDNDAVASTIRAINVVPNDRRDDTPCPIVLRGSQRICKFNKTDPEDVDISLALFRVNSGGKSADVVVSANIPRGAQGGIGEGAIESQFDTLVSSLRIIDYNLFG